MWKSKGYLERLHAADWSSYATPDEVTELKNHLAALAEPQRGWGAGYLARCLADWGQPLSPLIIVGLPFLFSALQKLENPLEIEALLGDIELLAERAWMYSETDKNASSTHCELRDGLVAQQLLLTLFTQSPEPPVACVAQRLQKILNRKPGTIDYSDTKLPSPERQEAERREKKLKQRRGTKPKGHWRGVAPLSEDERTVLRLWDVLDFY